MEINPFDNHKILYWRERVEQLRKGVIPDPVLVTIDPSNKCNSKCRHCFVKKFRNKNLEVLDGNTMLKVIRELAIGDVKAIAFCGGGEPLVNPATPQALLECKKHHIQAGLITNGNLFTKASMDIALKTCSFIRVSIDAADKEMYKLMHGITGFENVIQNMRYLASKSKNTEISASFLIAKYNYKQIPAFAELMSSIGVDRVTYKYIYTSYKGIDMGYVDTNWIQDNRDELETLLAEAKCFENERTKISYRHPSTFFNEKIKPVKELYKRCIVSPLNMATVCANGDLCLCCDRRGQLVIGSLKANSFWSLWRSSTMRLVYKGINVKDCPFMCKSAGYNYLANNWDKFDFNMI